MDLTYEIGFASVRSGRGSAPFLIPACPTDRIRPTGRTQGTVDKSLGYPQDIHREIVDNFPQAEENPVEKHVGKGYEIGVRIGHPVRWHVIVCSCGWETPLVRLASRCKELFREHRRKALERVKTGEAV